MGKTVRNDNDYVRNAKASDLFVPKVRTKNERKSVKRNLMKEFG